jgi:hypothetical protein
MANQQNNHFQDALRTHDHLKRSMDLPLFYTDDTKDTTTGWRLIERVEIAAGITTWDDMRKGIL